MSVEEKEEKRDTINHTEPGQLLVDIGLIDQSKLKTEMRRLSNGPFSWVNLATQDIPIGSALNAISKSDLVNPPRTGHMGGVWSRIVNGGGGQVSLNQVIRQEGLGYPLIFDQNQIPTLDGAKGDQLYYPGTIFTHDQEIDLPLYTIDGKPVDRQQPLFASLMMAKVDGQLVPLSMLHQREITSLVPDAVFVSQIITQHQGLVRELFNQILNRAEMEDDNSVKSQLLGLVANRVIARDGQVLDRRLSHNYEGYCLGGKTYSREEIVDLLIMPFLYTADPETYLNSLPAEMLRISKEMLIILMAVLNTDFYNGKNSLLPINPHLHWGAFQMAGAPPKKDGYFSGSANGLKTLMQVIRADLKETVPPIYYVLMPAAIFTLWPSENDEFGQEVMAQLIKSVHSQTDQFKGKPNQMISAINQLVDLWYNQYGEELPTYLRSRFSPFDSTRTEAFPPSPKFIKPPDFDKLTFRQASITVGALLEVVK